MVAWRQWSVDEVAQWIRHIGCDETQAATFRSFGVRGSDLKALAFDEEAIEELGFRSSFMRQKFMQLLHELTSKGESLAVKPAAGIDQRLGYQEPRRLVSRDYTPPHNSTLPTAGLTSFRLTLQVVA